MILQYMFLIMAFLLVSAPQAAEDESHSPSMQVPQRNQNQDTVPDDYNDAEFDQYIATPYEYEQRRLELETTGSVQSYMNKEKDYGPPSK